MPAEPLPQLGIVQVRIVGRIDGQETNNVLHFQAASAIDDIDLRIIQVLANCFITHLLPVITSSWTLEKFVWKMVSPALGPEFTSVPAGAGAGQGPAAALPSYCSAVFSIKTAQGGRSHRGRMYLAGIPEAATINSAFDTSNAFWLGLVAFALCITSEFIIGDPPGTNAPQLIVYSRKIGGAAFPYGASGATPMRDFSPVVQLGTTRSRKVGRGS